MPSLFLYSSLETSHIQSPWITLYSTGFILVLVSLSAHHFFLFIAWLYLKKEANLQPWGEVVWFCAWVCSKTIFSISLSFSLLLPLGLCRLFSYLSVQLFIFHKEVFLFFIKGGFVITMEQNWTTDHAWGTKLYVFLIHIQCSYTLLNLYNQENPVMSLIVAIIGCEGFVMII